MKSPAGTSSIRPYASFSSGAGSAGTKDRNRTATTTIAAKTPLAIQRNLRLSRAFGIGSGGAGGAVGAGGGIVANCGRGMSRNIGAADTDRVAFGIGCVVTDGGGQITAVAEIVLTGSTSTASKAALTLGRSFPGPEVAPNFCSSSSNSWGP